MRNLLLSEALIGVAVAFLCAPMVRHSVRHRVALFFAVVGLTVLYVGTWHLR